MTRRLPLIALALTAMASAAEAHTGIGGVTGFAHGFVHPLTGADHLAAMFAVGLLAARLGGRALWAVPGAFLAMMGLGALAGLAGATLPFVETGILLSVIVLGLAVLVRRYMTVAAATLLAGFFAVFHGFAHGTELPAATSALTRNSRSTVPASTPALARCPASGLFTRDALRAPNVT